MKRAKRITVRLTEPEAKKLDKIVKKITPRGSELNAAAAVRNLIEKEEL